MNKFPTVHIRHAALLAVLLCATTLAGCQTRSGEAVEAATAHSVRGANGSNAQVASANNAGGATVAGTPQPVAQPTPEIPNSSPLKLPLARPRILVLKAKRQLILFDGEKAVRQYRVGLGLSPEGDKEREGDRRTPEGNYYVCVKNARSNFLVSLGLSYPNEEDAARGLRAGLITKSQHARILRAIKGKQIPPWNTALGGQIFIHGNGSQSDWTWGCVALDNDMMQELFDAVPRGAPVTIKP